MSSKEDKQILEDKEEFKNILRTFFADSSMLKGKDMHRILGHMRIFQAVYADLVNAGEMEHDLETHSYIYKHDPFNFEDRQFPITRSLIKKAQNERTDRIVKQIEEYDIIEHNPLPQNVSIFPEDAKLLIGKFLSETDMKNIRRIIDETE
jgi:hypothetical protein